MIPPKQPPFSLALVTGASSGIGLALCELLADQGISLLVTGRDETRLNALAANLRAKVRVETVVLDLASSADLAKLVEIVHQQVPDLIVNCAGFGLYGDVLTYETKKQREIIDVNAGAVFELTVEAARSLVSKDKQGVILNVSSASDMLVFPSLAVYAASKAFVTQFSQSLDFELRPKGIRVLVSCPGRVDTSFSVNALGYKRPKCSYAMSAEKAAHAMWKQIVKRTPRDVFDWKTWLGTFALRFLMPKKMMAKILSSGLEAPPRDLVLLSKNKSEIEK